MNQQLIIALTTVKYWLKEKQGMTDDRNLLL